VATQLQIWNDALIMCGERTLANLTEAREPRRLLTDVWANGAVDHCLGEACWNFAARTQELAYDPAQTSQFGYQYAVAQPDDYVRIIKISRDEFLDDPLIRYLPEGGFWWSDCETIYVRYVSNGAAYGANLELWTTRFGQYVSAYLAARIIKRLTQSPADEDRMYAKAEKLLHDAKAKDAIEEATEFAPPGRITRARSGGSYGRGRRSEF
jgi:hypothetical protein